MKLHVGTRGSALALAQAADVARRLEALGHTTETVVISTAGDRTTDRGFSQVGTFGVFVAELEAALLQGRVDLAVHSYKDMPGTSPAGLVVAAVPERVDASDVLLVRREALDLTASFVPLRHAASVGTAAARRRALLSASRPDLVVGLLRGNVPTRVRALAEGRFDAIVLAAAGLLRLERASLGEHLVPDGIIKVPLDPSVFVPAPAQGAIAVQVRVDAAAVRAAVSALDDPTTTRALLAERTLLELSGSGCSVPFGAWCRSSGGGRLSLAAFRCTERGRLVRAEAVGSDPVGLANAMWRRLAEAEAA